MTEFIAQYWLGVVFGGIVTGLCISFKFMRKRLNEVREDFSAVKLGLQAMLRNSIIEQYNERVDKGYIPIYALENVTAMYKEYHALGGNGTITQLYEELLELPHRKEDVE